MKVLLLFSLVLFTGNSLFAQLVPGDVNKPINQAYYLSAVNFGTKGTPNIFVSAVPSGCSNTLTLTVQWNTNVLGGGTTVRHVDMHGGLNYSNTLIASAGSGVLNAANSYTRSFTLSPGIYTFGLHVDPFDDIIGNNTGVGVPGDDMPIVGGSPNGANDQTRCAVFGITVLPTNNNLHTATISHSNASNCTSADGSVTISGLNTGTGYEYSYLVNGAWTGATSTGSGTLTISGLLTGIYPVRIRRSSSDVCYRQFNIKVGNNTGVDCFADNQLIDASLGTNLVTGSDFGVGTGALPRNTAGTAGSGTTDYTSVTFNTSDPQDSRYAFTDSTNLRTAGFGANRYNWRLRNWQFASGGSPANYSQHMHLWSCIQRTGDHTGSLNQNNGNTGTVGQGQMMLVNANYRADKVLNISGMNLTAGNNYYFSFWAKNVQPFMPRNKNNQQRLDSTYQPILPRLAMAVNDRIYTFADIPANLEPAAYTGVDTVLEQAKWARYNMRFVSPVTTSTANITIYNFQQGGYGNDFAIDDIEFLALSVVGDRVWNDLDRDGIQDTNEPGMANVVVTLLDDNNAPLQTTVSDAFGYYQFANVSAAAGPGGTNYKVKFSLPASYIFTTKNAGGSTAVTDSDVNASGANFGMTDIFNLTTGNSVINIDCGLVFDQPLLPASIGNIVWLDTDSDGVQDNGESGLANVTVTLYNNVGVVVSTTVTDASGFYRFNNVTPGNYRVGVTQPTGTIGTPKDLGGDDNMDSDVNVSGGNIRKTDLFAVAANQQIVNVDFGIRIMPSNSSSFGDLCWKDLNSNGIQDAGEPGLPNVKIVLIDPSTDNTVMTGDDIRIDSTFTDAFGIWQFTNLTGSRYFITVTPPSGYSYTLQNQGSDETKDSDLNNTGISNIIYINNSPYGFNYPMLDIGFTITPPMPTAGSIGNYFWDDINGNGIQEVNEFGVPGITVELLDNTNAVIQSTTTDLDGFYKFPYVNPASGFSVRFSNIPPGYQFTSKDQGTTTTDSDVDLNTGTTNQFTLNANQVMDSIDAGIRQVLHTGNSSIGSYIWYDFNNNGIQDLGETGVPNINVTLRNPGPNGVVDILPLVDDITYTTTTNSLGQFVFNGITPGQYRVEMAYLTSRFTLATIDQGGNDNTDSDGIAWASGGGFSSVHTSNFRVLFGEDKLNIGFGLVPRASVSIIGNRVWKDKNSNGRQDAGENEGVQGAVVQLLNSTGTALVDADGALSGIQPYQTTTNEYGYWHIVGAPNATYIPRFALLPPGYRVTNHKIGTNVEDSDVLGDGRSSVNVVITGGTNYQDIDLGLIPQSAVLGDFVWDDLDGDGVQDAGEPGIGSTTATIYNSANVALGSAVTDAAGKYYFPNTPVGTYYMRYSNYPSGMQFTLPESTPYITNGSNVNPTTQRTNNYTISSYGDTLHIDAGLRVLNTANVGNYVWIDQNANGIQDAGERPISGIVVQLRNAGPDGISGNGDDYTLGTTITDGVGFYQFIITPTGNNYYLVFSNIPSGASFTTQHVGGAGASNNSKANASGVTANFNLLYGATNQIMDAGIINVTILDVDFEFFTAEKSNSNGLLNWKVTKPSQVAYYEIMHSTNGYSFSRIATINASISIADVTFLHQNPRSGTNYYQIVAYDMYGRSYRSDIRTITFGKSNSYIIYPNPVKDILHIDATNFTGNYLQYTIIDQNGKKVTSGRLVVGQINHISVINLASGIYSLLLDNDGNSTIANPFLKQ